MTSARNRPAPKARRPSSRRGAFPIVGLGASAGGLEAFEQFLRHVPPDSGMAFVVVQHLDPTHQDMLVELLQRSTPMKVLQIRDGTRVEPDRVYVIPPNRDLSIVGTTLHLCAPAAPRGLRLPIDSFFRSLADALRERSVGVVLSGMGSDGTLGVRAIKEQAGAVFVQAPSSAKFDAMPRSVIDAGLADFVGPVEELPAKIAATVARPRTGGPARVPAGKTESALEQICEVLRSQTGHDFSQYKRSTLLRRVERRMGLHQIDGMALYCRTLQDNPQETQLLFKELLIGVTSFFRDPEAWEHLEKKAIPALLSARSSGAALRAWVPGCSTGEEAYSLAIVFKDALAQLRPGRRFSLHVFATDLDKDAIDRARQGVYPRNIASDVSAERLRRYFVQEERGYRVTQELREGLVFAPQNVVMDPPFTKPDLVCCRNLLIYLSSDLQKKLLPLFHHSLNPGGLLFLGSAETVGTAGDLFASTGGKARIYRRLEVPRGTDRVEFPASFHPPTRAVPPLPAKASGVALQAIAERLLLERYSPAAVLTNGQGDILYVSGRTGRYLEPAAGKANWNLHAMAREGLRHELTSAFQRALRSGKTVALTGTTVEGSAHPIDVTIEPLQEPEALRGLVMVVFADAQAPTAVAVRRKGGPPKPVAPARTDGDLQRVRRELLTAREEMQTTSQEELTSANEELQSTNEELQSTNEELTTSREEMQSMNEELQTVNHELQARVDDLSRANDDMRNLLDSTDIATLFLDAELNVRRFTAQMTALIRLVPGDVKRPITDLASDLVYPELAADARAVLQTLVFKEKPVRTIDGRWFSARIMPYRTLDNRIDGVVITFVDITAAKTLEATLRRG